MTQFSIHPIGHVFSDVTAQTDQQWGIVTSRIELLPEYQAGLLGLDQFSHLLRRPVKSHTETDPCRTVRGEKSTCCLSRYHYVSILKLSGD